jgi:hypothetical protein
VAEQSLAAAKLEKVLKYVRGGYENTNNANGTTRSITSTKPSKRATRR